MKRLLLGAAAAVLLAACAKNDTSSMGSSPNTDTGVADQNTVTQARPDNAVGAGATASSGVGTATARGAAINETGAEGTNTTKPLPPPHR